MSFDAKALKEIAKACRAAGITKYKCQEFEFELSPEAPVSNYKKRTAKQQPEFDSPFSSENAISDEALLLWSAIDPSEAQGESQ